MLADVAASHPARSRSAPLHVALWLSQVALFAMFAMAGFLKLTTPIAPLSQTIPWVADVPVALVRFIGFSELAGAIALLLPSLTRIKPVLTPLAALGLAIVMVFAMVFHIARGELAALGMPIVLGGVAAFVAWGRFRKSPIEPRDSARG
jgi:putative oxidoreductase